MIRITSSTGSSTILQSLINAEDKDEVGGDESGGNKTNLLKPFASKKSIGAGYLTSERTKRGNGNTKKGFKAAKNSDYLTPDAEKAFNHLRHAFIQALIL